MYYIVALELMRMAAHVVSENWPIFGCKMAIFSDFWSKFSRLGHMSRALRREKISSVATGAPMGGYIVIIFQSDWSTQGIESEVVC